LPGTWEKIDCILIFGTLWSEKAKRIYCERDQRLRGAWVTLWFADGQCEGGVLKRDGPSGFVRAERGTIEILTIKQV
jgi:hypothetical protein